MLLYLLLVAGLAIGKFTLTVYHEEKIAKFIDRWFPKDLQENAARFELIKNSTSKGITDAKNPIFQKWYSLIKEVRKYASEYSMDYIK